MKIIHTADWHLGQNFKEGKRLLEHELFLKWLVKVIHNEQADALLIAGDVFDTGNPPVEALKLYYDFIKQVSENEKGCRIYLISGNHDSPNRLNAPKELLHTHQCFPVVYPDFEEFEKGLFPLCERGKDNPEGYLLAIPYSGYGRYFISSSSYSEGMAKSMITVSRKAKEMHPDMPLIGMAHLFASTGKVAKNDDSVRCVGSLDEVQIGNCSFDYLALGHLHRAQNIKADFTTRYSGSPISLSFSEINYSHGVDLIELKDKKVSFVKQIDYTSPVELIRIPAKGAGTYQEVKELLVDLGKERKEECNEQELYPFVEINMKQSENSGIILRELNKLVSGMKIRLTGIYASEENKNNEEEPEEKRAVDASMGLKLPEPLELAKEYYKNIRGYEMSQELELAFIDIIKEAEQL